MDAFKVMIPNGMTEKKVRKSIDRQIRKAVAQGRVSYTWSGKKVND